MIAYSRGNFFLKNTFLLSKPEYPFDMGVSNTGCILTAGVAKLVDAPDLGSGAARRGGSSPSTRTNILNKSYAIKMLVVYTYFYTPFVYVLN